MPSANKTNTIQLNQWQSNEYPKMDDFNSDNLKIDNKFKEQSTQLSDYTQHKADTTTAHGSTSSATANKIALRDSSGNLLANDFKVGAYSLIQAVSSGKKIQVGTGSVAITTANAGITKTITFPVAFSSAPLVLVTLNSVSGDAGVYITSLAYSITTTGVTISFSSGAIQTNLNFTWIAIGN